MKLFNKLFGTLRPSYRNFSELKPSDCFRWEGQRYVKLNSRQAYVQVGDTGVIHAFDAYTVVQLEESCL